jgi:lysophospholipase L1-like esterase
VRLLAVLVGLAASTLAGEAYLRLSYPPRYVLHLNGGEGFWIDRWLRDRPDAEESGRVVHDPTLGWRPRAGYRSESLNVNSRGARGLREVPYEKARDEQRIVAIGDSFTFGCVGGNAPVITDDGVYTAQLEERLGATVVNLGVEGYGTGQQLLYLREEGLRYDPDLVLLCVFVDDLRRAALSFRDYAKPRFVIEAGEVRLTGVPVPGPEELARELRPAPPLSYLWTRVWKGTRDARRAREVERLNEALLDAFLDDVTQYGSSLLVVVIPDRTWRERVDRCEPFLAEWCRRRKVPLLALREAFETLAPDLQDRLYVGHWTPLGHEVVADAMAEKILTEELLSDDKPRSPVQ